MSAGVRRGEVMGLPSLARPQGQLLLQAGGHLITPETPGQVSRPLPALVLMLRTPNPPPGYSGKSSLISLP